MKKIIGRWNHGIAVAPQNSEMRIVGYGESGKPEVVTIRSELGESLYQLKHKNDRTALPHVISTLTTIGGLDRFDAFLSAPPSVDRGHDAVEDIARALGAAVQVPLLERVLSNSGDRALKAIAQRAERERYLRTAINVAPGLNLSGKRVLLIDDIYRSGATLNACCDALRRSAKANSISVLSVTWWNLLRVKKPNPNT